MKKSSSTKKLCGFAVCLMFLLSGCAAVQKAGDFAADRVGAGYALTQDALTRADDFKATVAADNLARAEKQVEFSVDFGRDVDSAGLSWLDSHLQRIGNFICALDARGIQVEDVATAIPNRVARLDCLDSVTATGGAVPPATAE